jgi:hypothetical protein
VVANSMLRGTVDPVLGSKVAYLMSVLLRAFEVEGNERRDAATRMSAEAFGAKVRTAIRLAMATVPDE